MAPFADPLALDPLTTALDELRLRCTPIRSSAEEAARRVEFPRDAVSLHVVIQGDWLIDADLALRSRWVERGQVLVVNGRLDGGIYNSAGEEPQARILSMRVDLDAPDGHPLLAALPPLIQATPERGFPSFALTVDALLDESLRRLPGRMEVIRQLSEVLFVLALRSHLDDVCWNDVGWFRALADPLLRDHLHWAPEGRSSVEALAQAAHRSSRRIRARFGQFAGLRPSSFLRSARARGAARLLRHGEADLERIAALTGYGSRQALARAFRRELGVSPTEYWRQVHRRPFPRVHPPPSSAPTVEASTSAARPHPSEPE